MKLANLYLKKSQKPKVEYKHFVGEAQKTVSIYIGEEENPSVIDFQFDSEEEFEKFRKYYESRSSVDGEDFVEISWNNK